MTIGGTLIGSVGAGRVSDIFGARFVHGIRKVVGAALAAAVAVVGAALAADAVGTAAEAAPTGNSLAAQCRFHSNPRTTPIPAAIRTAWSGFSWTYCSRLCSHSRAAAPCHGHSTRKPNREAPRICGPRRCAPANPSREGPCQFWPGPLQKCRPVASLAALEMLSVVSLMRDIVALLSNESRPDLSSLLWRDRRSTALLPCFIGRAGISGSAKKDAREKGRSLPWAQILTPIRLRFR